MALRRKRGRRFRRRKGRRGGRRRGRGMKMTRWSLPRRTQVIPDKVYVKLAYTTLLHRLPAAASDEYVFRGNSGFDTDVTAGSNQQPLGFDQYSAFFGEQRVYSSSIKLQVVNNVSSSGMHMSIIPTPQSGGSGSFITSVQQPYVKFRFAGASQAQSKIHLKNYMTTAKLWGRPVKNEDDFASLVTQNPINEWFWVIETNSSDQAAALDYDMLVKVVYYIEFSKRKILAAS